MVGGAYAQNMPACQGHVSTWNDCFGTSLDGTTGNKYVGEFKNGKFSGEGKMLYVFGSTYLGQWKNGNRHGQGVYEFANGDKYVGQYKDNRYEGEGTLYATNGSIINQGLWANGSFVRSAPVQQATAPNTEIEKRSNLPACQGADASKWSNCYGTSSIGGGKYDGEFKIGKLNGKGIYTYIDGTKYIGSFEDDMFNGSGTLYSSRGDVIKSGFWVRDKFIGSSSEKATELSLLENKIPLQKEESIKTTVTGNTLPQLNEQATAIAAEKRIALVVGNANYKTRPLRNPRNDADDVSNALKSSGFQVIDLRDATLQQMRNSVRQFGDRLINNDVGLVYYSGHGVEVKGRNYFIPVNTDIMREDEIADQGLDVSLILEKMNTAGKGVNILIVDACRDDPFGRSFRSSSRGLAQMDAPRGTIIAYSTSPGKVAADGDGRNSPYTKNLVRAMQQPNKPIEQVFKEVRRAVQEETKNQQTPWENTSLSGDFYFLIK